jgi:hypothetical protein
MEDARVANLKRIIAVAEFLDRSFGVRNDQEFEYVYSTFVQMISTHGVKRATKQIKSRRSALLHAFLDPYSKATSLDQLLMSIGVKIEFVFRGR